MLKIVDEWSIESPVGCPRGWPGQWGSWCGCPCGCGCVLYLVTARWYLNQGSPHLPTQYKVVWNIRFAEMCSHLTMSLLLQRPSRHWWSVTGVPAAPRPPPAPTRWAACPPTRATACRHLHPGDGDTDTTEIGHYCIFVYCYPSKLTWIFKIYVIETLKYV